MRSEQLQQQVISGISDDDFMKELARRMGKRANSETVQAVQREINDNKILDKDSLVEMFLDIGAETKRGAVENNKLSFDQTIYRKMKLIPELTNLKSENFLQSLNPRDNTHYSEIAQSISERIQDIETVTVRDLKLIVGEEYQSDHTPQRQQSASKVGGRY